MLSARTHAIASLFLALVVEPGDATGSCDFAVVPSSPGFFWDPTCDASTAGCNADGKNLECRFCGGDYGVACPPSSCHFVNEPYEPYYWDESCDMGKLGCWADGIHAQCRFCGDGVFSSVMCPPQIHRCTFMNKPATPFYWDPDCKHGVHGCFADGLHEECRFCGEGLYSDIVCPGETQERTCTFEVEPDTPHYWDPACAMGVLGCNADGIHLQCRFCAGRPFESVRCPVDPPRDRCYWEYNVPTTPFFWDPSCELGKLGCWADGVNPECRFCGEGVYASIACGNSSSGSQRRLRSDPRRGRGASAGRGPASARDGQGPADL